MNLDNNSIFIFLRKVEIFNLMVKLKKASMILDYYKSIRWSLKLSIREGY